VIALLSAAAVVVLALALGLPSLSDRTVPADPDTTQKSAADAETPLSPLLLGTGVIHIKGTIMGRTSAGEESDQVIIEFWYDRDTGDALYHRREVGDTRPEDFYSAYEQGRGYSRVFRPNGIAQIYPENSVRSRALRPLVMMFERKLYILQGNLKTTDRVTAPSGQVALISKHRINAPLDKDTSVTYLDKATNLPKCVTNTDLPTTRIGGKEQHLTGDLRYEWSTIETVERSSLPRSLFAMESYATVVPHSTPPSWLYPTADPRLTPQPTVEGEVSAITTPYAPPVATEVP